MPSPSPLPVLDIDLEIEQQGIPVSWQGTYRRALAGSRSAACKCMCGLCQGWEDGARQAIRECTLVGCPNHAVRPFQKKVGIGSGVGDPEIDNEDGEEPEDSNSGNVNTLADVKSKILDHLDCKGESARGYIIFSTGIPESLWTDAIRELLIEGEIEREGEKRSTRYRLREDRL